MGKVCIVNCTDLVIDIPRHRGTIGPETLREGDAVSLDGNTGAVYKGIITVKSERPAALIAAMKQWRELQSG